MSRQLTGLKNCSFVISDISKVYKVLREEYIALKKEQIVIILQFLNKTEPSGYCLICYIMHTLVALEEAPFIENSIVLLESIENKLCRSCILKLHSKQPKFCLNFNFSFTSCRLQKYIESLCSLHSKHSTSVDTTIPTYKLKDILVDLAEMENNNEYKKYKTLEQFFRCYRAHTKKIKLKNIIKNQIEYKIDTIEEQLKVTKINHSNSILQGNLEESKNFQEIYYNLFELKLELEEKQYNYEHL